MVKACLNGSRSKSEHDAVPVSAEEIATDAKLAFDVGAGAVHIHPRGLNGRETFDPEYCAEAVTRVRALCPRIPLGVSTASWIEGNPAKRLAAISRWEVLPDFASVNFNEKGYGPLCSLLLKRGIAVEAGIWSVEDAVRLVKSRLDASCLRILVEITEKDPERAVVIASEIERCLRRSGAGASRLHHGYGRATWSVMKNAAMTGKDVRVGMEDTTVLADGTRAKDNKQLVEAAIRLVRRLGREPSKVESRSHSQEIHGDSAETI